MSIAADRSARILIIDDEIGNVRLLEDVLSEDDYTNLKSTTDSRDALELYTAFQPDLVLLDLMMPHLDGFQVMEQLGNERSAGDFVPVLVLTADVAVSTKRRALSAGANDFLTKPFDLVEVRLRIQNLLALRFMHLEVQNQAETLEKKVRERTFELAESQIEVVERLAQAAEYRDDDTGRHTQRVGVLSELLASRLGLPTCATDVVRRAAPLHDVGKIGIPDSVLLKPGRLLPEEFDRMKAHTTIGASLLRNGRSETVQMAERIALSHHERWNGSGYPHGLRGEDIPLEGRIVAVADVFDALTHVRPYKLAWPLDKALAEIESQGGRQFDPTLVTTFLQFSADMLQKLL